MYMYTQKLFASHILEWPSVAITRLELPVVVDYHITFNSSNVIINCSYCVHYLFVFQGSYFQHISMQTGAKVRAS